MDGGGDLAPSPTPGPSSASSTNWLWQNTVLDVPTVTLPTELEIYMAEADMEPHEDPLQWWEKPPILYKLAL